MIRLGLRLIGGDRESLARLAVTAVSVAVGVGLLLASLASMNAVNSQSARGAWLSTQPGGSSVSASASHSSALWWSAINDEFEGQTIYRIDVATTGPRSPVPPGMTRLPRAGQYFVSPALARLLASTPAAELGDRFPGREVGTIGAAGLPNPNALIVVVGYSVHQLSRIPGAEQITSIAGPGTPNGSGSNSEQFVIVLVIAALALLFPVLVFLATATRLAAARREQRFAAMRLVGATPRQISTIAAVEALAAAVIGVVLGFVLFVVLRPALQHVPITGAPFAPGDLSLGFADIMLVAIGVPFSALLAARAALRRVLISPRWGWKRAYQHRRREGHRVNKKRIQRLWRAEGLKVPYRKRKKPLRGLGVHVGAMSPIRPNAIWAMDFQFDETRDGRQLKLLNIQDIFTRECLAVHVRRSITADDLMNVLDELVARHGAPTFLRCDNGPEFAAFAIADWCKFNNASTTFIDPGSPWQNGHIESFNSRIRDEYLNGHLFDSLLEAQVLLEDWRREYNHERLHSSLCYLTPVEFKELWEQQHQQRLSLALDLDH